MQFTAGGGVGQAVTRPWGGHNATRLTPPSSFMGVDVRYCRPVSSLQASAWAAGIPTSWRAMGLRVFCVTENYEGLARYIWWGVCEVYFALIQNSLTLNFSTPRRLQSTRTAVLVPVPTCKFSYPGTGTY